MRWDCYVIGISSKEKLLKIENLTLDDAENIVRVRNTNRKKNTEVFLAKSRKNRRQGSQ